MSIDPNQLVKRVLKVASLPQIFIKVEQTLNDPHSSNIHLGRIIEEDPALTARLLRLANSAFYGFAVKVETVTQAITILGTQQLRELVLACSVLKIFKDIPSEQLDMESFWRHSVACGLAARALAGLRYESNIERYFVAGLMHDIGRLILLMERPKEMINVFNQIEAENQLSHVVERQLLGFTHARLGGLLLANWKLSSRLVECVAYHHSPTSAKQFPTDAAIIHTADITACAMQLGSSGNDRVPTLNVPAWESLGLNDDCIETVVKTVREQYRDAVSFILDE